jgi:hypothetical protein
MIIGLLHFAGVGSEALAYNLEIAQRLRRALA